MNPTARLVVADLPLEDDEGSFWKLLNVGNLLLFVDRGVAETEDVFGLTVVEFVTGGVLIDLDGEEDRERSE